MLKKVSILIAILLLSGCAGIAFCDSDGKPKGCRKWDPATTTGAVGR